MEDKIGKAFIVALAKHLDLSEVERAAQCFAASQSIKTCAVRLSEPFSLGGSHGMLLKAVELRTVHERGSDIRLDRFCHSLQAAGHGALCARYHSSNGIGAVLFFDDRKVVTRVHTSDREALSRAVGSVLENLHGTSPANALGALEQAAAKAFENTSLIPVCSSGESMDPFEGQLAENWLVRRLDNELEVARCVDLLRPVAKELVRLGRSSVRARRSARFLDSDAGDAALEAAEASFYEIAKAVDEDDFTVDQLAAVFVTGGLAKERAYCLSRAVLYGDSDEFVEDDTSPTCAHCRSALRGPICPVCGLARGSKPESNEEEAALLGHAERAQHLVDALVTSEKIVLASNGAKGGVVAGTIAVLAEHADADDDALAEHLSEAWLSREDVAELFADENDVVALLRSNPRVKPRRLTGQDEPGRRPRWASFFSLELWARFVVALDDYFQSRGVAYQLHVDENDACITLDGRSGEYGLSNLGQKCNRAARDEWSDVIRDHFDATLTDKLSERADALAADFSLAAPALRLRLWSQDAPLASLVRWEIAEGLTAILAFVVGNSAVFVTEDKAGRWGVSRDELFRLALANTRADGLLAVGDVAVSGPTRVHILEGGATLFATTHVLFLEDYGAARTPFGALVAVPHRHSVVFHPIEDQRALTALQSMAQVVPNLHRQGPGSLCPDIYWWRGPGSASLLKLAVTIDETGALHFDPPSEFAAVVLNRLPPSG